jgi:uncharacterized protein (DUF433 family)
MATIPLSHVEVTPGVCGGKPRIAGHRIRVQDIVAWIEEGGHTPDDVVTTIYPQLSLSQVHAALAYYFDHMAEIQQDMREDAELSADLKASTPSLLEKKLKDQDGGPDSLSPG